MATVNSIKLNHRGISAGIKAMSINESEYIIETSRSGNSIIVVKSGSAYVPLNSRLDPVKEGGKVSFDFDPERFSLLIILGCSLGYHLIESKDILSKYRKIIVIDILDGIENEILKNDHTSFLARGENILFYSGKDLLSLEKDLMIDIDFNLIRGVQVIEHGASVRVFGEYYNSARGIIKRIIDREARNSSTVKAFGRLFLRNALNNFRNFSRVSPLTALENAFSGSKALIVSSAPSIEDYIDSIYRLRDYFYIVAVDSALPILSAKGIIPDFVISIDPQPRLSEHFLGEDLNNSLCIFSIVSNPDLVKRYGGYLSLNSHPVSQIIDDFNPGLVGSIDSGTGSVAGDALNFCVYAGFESIGMAGFDFSFSGNNIYARGTAYQRRYSTIFNNRFITTEGFNASYIFKSSGAYMSGGKYTRKAFTGYRDSLESFIEKRRITGISFINKRGLPVKGVKYENPDDFVSGKGEVDRGIIGRLLKVRGADIGSMINFPGIYGIMSNEAAAEEIIKASWGKAPEQKDMDWFSSLLGNGFFKEGDL